MDEALHTSQQVHTRARWAAAKAAQPAGQGRGLCPRDTPAVQLCPQHKRNVNIPEQVQRKPHTKMVRELEDVSYRQAERAGAVQHGKDSGRGGWNKMGMRSLPTQAPRDALRS